MGLTVILRLNIAEAIWMRVTMIIILKNNIVLY